MFRLFLVATLSNGVFGNKEFVCSFTLEKRYRYKKRSARNIYLQRNTALKIYDSRCCEKWLTLSLNKKRRNRSRLSLWGFMFLCTLFTSMCVGIAFIFVIHTVMLCWFLWNGIIFYALWNYSNQCLFFTSIFYLFSLRQDFSLISYTHLYSQFQFHSHIFLYFTSLARVVSLP